MNPSVARLASGKLMAGQGPNALGHPRAAFVPVERAAEWADEVRGDVDALPDRAVIYIGESTAKHYYTSHDPDVLSDSLREAVESRGHTIVGPVLGGWVEWEGRPEFSDWYIDVTDAGVVFDA